MLLPGSAESPGRMVAQLLGVDLLGHTGSCSYKSSVEARIVETKVVEKVGKEVCKMPPSTSTGWLHIASHSYALLHS